MVALRMGELVLTSNVVSPKRRICVKPQITIVQQFTANILNNALEE